MIFASDNWAGASDKVVAALAGAARTGGPAYGGDPLTRAVETRFGEVFERQVTAFLVGTGTAANALALSAFARPGGVVFCHREAHINADEAGSIHFFGGGMKLHLLDGAGAKLTADSLERALAAYPRGNVHHGLPVAVSLTEITELGQVYEPGEIAEIADVAHERGLAVHMDGARFAGAVASLGISPAELTWKSGVDVMSFGATKNGCLAAEAVIFFFKPHAIDHFGLSRQRAGQGYSKAWFMSAQLDAYLDGGHWLDLARHANGMAKRLADAIRASASARLLIEPAANEVFAVLKQSTDDRLKAAGAAYHPWGAESFPQNLAPSADEVSVRLVTSFRTTADEVDRFAAILAGR